MEDMTRLEKKKKWNLNWENVVIISLISHLTFFVTSCARMGSPDGGWYDDTPPRVLRSTPNDGGTHVTGRRVTINFNEFIKIEDVQNKVIISPPQLEMPDIKAQGKRIVIDLKDSLKWNTTYTVDFSDAISDNNEGNPMGNYTFSFSTGDVIDTLRVSGYALDASNLEPIKGILIGLYEDSTFADSTFHKLPMMRVSRTNGSGFFTIKGVAPGRYRIRALQDTDGDFIHGQKSEMIGFNDEVIVPTVKQDVRQDTLWTDALHINNIQRVGYTHFLPDDVTLLCFQAPQTDRFLIKTERKDPEKIGLFFTYGSDSLPKMHGLNFNADSAFVIEASEKLDTVYYWLCDTSLVNQDTLRMELTYQMTDTTGLLIQKVDTIEAIPKISYEKRLKEKNKEFEKWQKEQEKKKKKEEPYDSIMPREPLKLKLSANGMIAPNENVFFEFPVPLKKCIADSVHLYSMIDSVWYRAPHLFEQVNIRTYVLKAEWRPGIEYSLEIDSAAFESIYGLANKPIKTGLKIRTEDDFSSLQVNITTPIDSGQVIVQLINSSDKIEQEGIVEGGSAVFYFLKPGKYYVRAFIDQNSNSIWDTGNYDSHQQAEPMFYYHEALECKAKWDVSRDWKLDEKPRYLQKPREITKQKPDQAKELKNRNAQRAADKGIPVPVGL